MGSALAKDPEGRPILYIKGPATRFVRDLIEDEDVPIRIVDEQPYSFDELEQRKMRVHNALLEMGFEQVSTGVDIEGGGVIRAGVLRTPGAAWDEEEILGRLPEDLRSSVELIINDSPIHEEDHAFGGQKTTYTGDNTFCTSGWTVYDITETGPRYGVTDAGHCSIKNRISAANHHMTLRGEHYGSWGDVEWFTTDTNEIPEFFAGPDTRRPVLQVEPRESISVNETICLFGRGSLVKNCTAKVDYVSQACGSLNRMVVMDKDIGQSGDSGGPWFYGNRAYGGHHGPCGTVPNRDAFSAAALFWQALGVEVVVFE